MRAAVVFNLKRKAEEGMPGDMYAEFDDISVPKAIQSAIEKDGFSVDLVEYSDDAYDMLRKGGYDFVFNIAEGLHGDSRESHIPSVLEMLRIPYTASGVLTQAVTLDKARTKEILLYHGLPTPSFQVFCSKHERRKESLRFPLVVKPNSEGSSKGITSKSLVRDDDELMEAVSYIIDNYRQPALAEEFLPGREFTVALLGNEKVYRLPIIEIHVNRYPDGSGMYHYENKFVNDDKRLHTMAELDPALESQIYSLACRAYHVLGCKDLSRVDIRCDCDGKPSIIEINCLPGLNPDPEYGSYFTLACLWPGLTYDEMISAVVFFALKRHGQEGMIDRAKISGILRKLESIDSKGNVIL